MSEDCDFHRVIPGKPFPAREKSMAEYREEHAKLIEAVDRTEGENEPRYSESEISAAIKCHEEWREMYGEGASVWSIFSHLEGRCHCARSTTDSSQTEPEAESLTLTLPSLLSVTRNRDLCSPRLSMPSKRWRCQWTLARSIVRRSGLPCP